MQHEAGKIQIKIKRTLEKFDGEKRPDSVAVETIQDEWVENFPTMEAAQEFLNRIQGVSTNGTDNRIP